jgi:hypothetical protein
MAVAAAAAAVAVAVAEQLLYSAYYSALLHGSVV